ncbi:MAG: hypothetical protein Q7T56_14770 [Nocardioidaceae bacterium]|nr:hypothetical protein [Nocardioidaceae bacterium]
MSRLEFPAHRWWHYLVVVPVALVVGVLGGLALGGLLNAAWFGRFMLGPGGGALLTVLATSAIGLLAYQQGNMRLAYESQREANERNEATRIRNYDEEKRIVSNVWRLAALLDMVVSNGSAADTDAMNKLVAPLDELRMLQISNVFEPLATVARCYQTWTADKSDFNQMNFQAARASLERAIQDHMASLRRPRHSAQ